MRKACGQLTELLIDLSKALPLRTNEQSAIVRKALVALGQEAQVYLVQVQLLPLVIDGANAGEERLVEQRIRRQLAKPVREGLRELHHLGTRVSGEQIVKGSRDRLQRLPTLLEATNRIVKGGWLTLCRDCVNLCTM